MFFHEYRLSRGGVVGVYVIKRLSASVTDTQLLDEVVQIWIEVRLACGRCLIGVIHRLPLVSIFKMSSVESVLSQFSANYNNAILLGAFHRKQLKFST